MPKQKKSSLLNMVERERFRVAATVTQEKEWPQNEPNQGLARMFVVMLLVHVAVIAGVILYDFIAVPTVKAASTASQSKINAPAVVSPAIVARPVPTSLLPETNATVPNAVPAVASPSVARPVAAIPAPARSFATAPTPELLSTPPCTMTVVSLPPPTGATAPVVASTLPKPAPAPAVAVVAQPAPRPVVQSFAAVNPTTNPAMSAQPVPTPNAAREDLRNAPAPAKKPIVIKSTPPAPKRKPEPVVVKRKPEPTPVKRTGGTVRHTIGKGDTLFGLARKYKVSADTIIKANALKNPNVLPSGRVLIIPR